LRIGELLALRWRSLDLEIGTLSVRESVFEGKFQSPKRRNLVERFHSAACDCVAPGTSSSSEAYRSGRTRVWESQRPADAGI
jgi:hypothetical protein